MSFVTWLALPVVITLLASLIMLLVSHWPRGGMHHDIEDFTRFRIALARQTGTPPVAPPAAADEAPAPVGTGIASSSDR